jgi:hypothetical protein
MEQILKLLRVADYEPASAQQQGPTEDEKRSALKLASIKLAQLKLKVMDLDELRPQPPPTPSYAGTTTWSYTSNNIQGQVTIVNLRVTIS